MADVAAAVRKMLEDVLAPLFGVEGGEVYLVSASAKEVALHLGGTLSGSPATPVVTRRVVEPAVKAVAPKAKVVISSGWRVPAGAEKIG
jgi:Fe-S cluster biogenesis protein NfuA